MKLKFRGPGPELTYPEDVERIVKALAAAGYEVSPIDAERAWEAYSTENLAATGEAWAPMPEADAEIVEKVRKYFEELLGHEAAKETQK